jgi:hypothetical protein
MLEHNSNRNLHNRSNRRTMLKMNKKAILPLLLCIVLLTGFDSRNYQITSVDAVDVVSGLTIHAYFNQGTEVYKNSDLSSRANGKEVLLRTTGTNGNVQCSSESNEKETILVCEAETNGRTCVLRIKAIVPEDPRDRCIGLFIGTTNEANVQITSFGRITQEAIRNICETNGGQMVANGYTSFGKDSNVFYAVQMVRGYDAEVEARC